MKSNICARVAGKRRVFRATALSIGAATLLAACGSSTTASSSSPSTSSAASTTSAPVSVTLAKAVNIEPFAVPNVAQSLGYFKKEGLNVKTVTVAGSVVATTALESGSVQFILASPSAVMLAKAKGIPLLSVGEIEKNSDLQLVVSNAWIKAHHLSPTQPLTQIIKGLEGSKDATLSTTDKAAMKQFEQVAGVPSSSISEVSMNSASAMEAALEHNLAQEFILSPPDPQIMQAAGLATVLASVAQLPYQSNIPFTLLITTPSYAKAHPTVVSKMVKAFQKAVTQMSKGSSGAVAALQPLYPTLKPAVIKSSLLSLPLNPSMQQTQTGWKNALIGSQKTGLVPANDNVNISEGSLWTNQFLG
jgi:NitT/TauT family transport system substrate-binding protein